jgi:hypothetical protein
VDSLHTKRIDSADFVYIVIVDRGCQKLNEMLGEERKSRYG